MTRRKSAFNALPGKTGWLLLGLAVAGILWWIFRGQSAVETWQIARATPDELFQASQKQSSDLRLRAAAAQRLLRAGRPSDALTLLSSPVPEAADSDLRCELEGSRARALIETGQLDDGRAVFLSVLKGQPTCIPAAFAEGLWLEQNDAWNPAAQVFDVVTRHQPDDPDGWYYLGVARSRNRELVSAAEALDHAIRLEPRRARDEVALGNLYATKADYHRAVGYYQEALRLEPANHLALAELAYAEAAGAQTQAEYLRARKDLKAAQDLAPDRLDAALGALELRFGDASTARSDLVQALCRGNRTPGLWFQLATADRRLGRASEAADITARFRAANAARLHAVQLARSLALQPANLDVALQLGAAYAASRQTEKAKTEYLRILRLHSGNQAAAHALKALSDPPADPLCAAPAPETHSNHTRGAG